MSDESIVEEGVMSSRFSRRSLIKAGAIVGGTVWVAPVIDSFANAAAASSQLNYCCTCFGSTSSFDQCIEDSHPPSAAACQSICASFGAGYTTYIWCAGSKTAYGCNAAPAIGVDLPSNGLCTGGCAPTCCTAGTV
ncbi:MAG: hypothetical protein ACRDZP_09660 [Acidimicrobiales bacterium]